MSVLTIATIAVGFDIDVNRDTRDRVADSAFALAEQSARQFLPIDDVGIEAIVERGSVDVFVVMMVTIPTLLTVLTNYGSAAEGFDRLKADIKAMKRYFVKELPTRAQLPQQAFESSRLTMEELSKIGRFITEVQKGTLPAVEGAKKACAELELFDAPLDAETRRQLEKSFVAIEPKPEARHRRLDEERAREGDRQAVAAPRRRLPRKPERVDRIRVWRNPGEASSHREETNPDGSRRDRPSER